MNHTPATLCEVVARVMELDGGVVDLIEPDTLEFIAPERLQQELGIAEHGRLVFGSPAPADAQRVTLESDWLERLSRVVGSRGQSLRRVLRVPLPPIADPTRVLNHRLTLKNAVHRLVHVTPAWTRYLILSFRYTCISDEKRDGIVHLGFNLSTGSASDQIDLLIKTATAPGADEPMPLHSQTSLPPPWNGTRLTEVIAGALPPRIEAQLGPFLASMRRRLGRDLGRVWAYYTDLKGEALKRSRKQQQEEEKLTQLRLDAISREYQAKVADLMQKYAMRIDVSLISTIELIMPVQRFEALIKRRKRERRVQLD
jgi:hypothetical protein